MKHLTERIEVKDATAAKMEAVSGYTNVVLVCRNQAGNPIAYFTGAEVAGWINHTTPTAS